MLPVTVVSIGQENEKNPKEKYEVEPFLFLFKRETYDYMGFLEIDFLNKGQNAVDEVDRAKTAA